MTVVDFHPEDLLDKAQRGELTPHERHTLDEHLATCEACAFERLAMAEIFEDVHEVDGALFSFAPAIESGVRQQEAPAPAEHEPRVEARPAARRLGQLAIAAAALLVVTSSAAAAIVVGAVLRGRRAEPEASVVVLGEVRVRRSNRRPLESARTRGAAVPAEAAPLVQAPAPDVPAQHRARRALVAPPSAAELFAAAGEARRAGRATAAVELYERLGRLHSGSREEVASRVILGRLLLQDAHRPADALRAFDGYLRAGGDGALALEARVGRALALGRLGQREREASAWREVLARHPGSVHTRMAQERLATLAQ